MPTSTQVHNHTQAVAAAKGALQAALVGASAAAAKAAHVTYYKAVLASARTNAHSTGALKALQSLGVDVTDGRDGDT
jgi:hypothetical protein